MNDLLIEGRIVHYVAFNNRHLAAIVIGCEPDGTSDLTVFTNMKNVVGTQNFGIQFHQEVKHSEEKVPGTWHWIERS